MKVEEKEEEIVIKKKDKVDFDKILDENIVDVEPENYEQIIKKKKKNKIKSTRETTIERIKSLDILDEQGENVLHAFLELKKGEKIGQILSIIEGKDKKYNKKVKTVLTLYSKSSKLQMIKQIIDVVFMTNSS